MKEGKYSRIPLTQTLMEMKSNSSCSSDSFSVFNNYTTRRAIIIGWHPSGVTRTRIRVLGVNLSKF